MESTTWSLDPAHSEIHFKVKHLMITNVTGSFAIVKASIETKADDFAHAKVSFTADAASVTTNNEQRDAHLKSGDFFEPEKYPEISFDATDYTASSGKLTGNLVIKGISKPVTLDVDFHGTNKDPWGNEKAGFSLSGKISRKDWNLHWNATLESGGVLVSDEVKLVAELQFVKAA